MLERFDRTGMLARRYGARWSGYSVYWVTAKIDYTCKVS